MQNEMVKRLMWSGLMTGVGALAAVLAHRVAAAAVWRRVFDEEPPE